MKVSIFNFWVTVEHRCTRCGWLPTNRSFPGKGAE